MVLESTFDACWPSELDPAEEIFDLIRDIKDPEHPFTLEQLNVVSLDQIEVLDEIRGRRRITIEFTPTVPSCSLATLIGLCIRVQVERSFENRNILDITVPLGSHDTAEEVNKQINDKERTVAAMENPDLVAVVERCLNPEHDDVSV
ncbi:hypothetical protein SARC_04000 [Sphaeroforma arctica JP610]|uniref:MIP18 family-like domain-containing protein n=1 Tax=Sphaeroforma arctica JP610 TaxID=667725 RepID=A0A0L0G4P5_9EUKA|nr:hypothetical protein SARC_04000 [Sphaeroforma arctica JP610]KNC83776.1 hypothetical protein SARC_04000 [Sphaeroforma arctica JP610]|eukprot:XP_014157678.1 hypothetical protein SARC_04000 [Sphaeroforma arctica JP610]